MKKTILLAILVLGAGYASAQIKFEPGYFINNDGQRQECLIRNVDWKNNPTSFEYQMAGGSETKVEGVANVMEFGIPGSSIFRRQTVDIDRSPDDINRLTQDRNPVYASETLFLRVLLSGKGSLFQYQNGNLTRFFYQMDQQPVQQLVYKRFLVGIDGENVTKNELYKQQLFNDLQCASLEQGDFARIDYKRKDLMKLFVKYNECQGADVASQEDIDKKGVIHVRLRPGMTFNAFTLTNTVSNQMLTFSNTLSYRVGVEMEYIFPFNKGQWALTLEPVYQGYSNTSEVGSVPMKYTSVDLNANVRRYFFLSDENKVYFNAGVTYSVPVGANELLTLDFSSAYNLSLGAGYMVKRFSVEVNYAFRRGITGNYSFFNSSYTGPSLILGYRLTK